MDIFEAMHIVAPFPSALTIPETAEKTGQPQSSRQQFIEAIQTLENRYVYDALDEKQGRSVALAALDLFEVDLKQEFASLPASIIENLARTIPHILDGLYDRFLEYGVALWSPQTFRRADTMFRDKLLALAQETPWQWRGRKYHRGELLCALAWIGDEVVQSAFFVWLNDPPTWTNSPSLNLVNILQTAGWEFTTDGKRRNLSLQEHIRFFAPHPEGIERANTSIILSGNQAEERCKWCGRKLILIFDLSLGNPRLTFLWPEARHLRVATCINCAMQYAWEQERVFIDIDTQGSVRWSSENGPKPPSVRVDAAEKDGIALLERLLVIGEARNTPDNRCSDYLGGYPEWIQTADYPICPTCQRTMIFIGQMEPDVPYLEGTIYAFLCKACGKTTIGYQQT